MSTNGLGFKIFLIPVFPLMLASFSASASNAFSNWLDRRVATSEAGQPPQRPSLQNSFVNAHFYATIIFLRPFRFKHECLRTLALPLTRISNPPGTSMCMREVAGLNLIIRGMGGDPRTTVAIKKKRYFNGCLGRYENILVV